MKFFMIMFPRWIHRCNRRSESCTSSRNSTNFGRDNHQNVVYLWKFNELQEHSTALGITFPKCITALFSFHIPILMNKYHHFNVSNDIKITMYFKLAFFIQNYIS